MTTNTADRERATEDADAIKVLKDIDNEDIFDDVNVDFATVIEDIIPREFLFASEGKTPSQGEIGTETNERAAQDLRDYFQELCDVIQKRYDECKLIIETYFRNQITSFQKNAQSKCCA